MDRVLSLADLAGLHIFTGNLQSPSSRPDHAAATGGLQESAIR
jgi:hypothetical protein